MGHYPGKVPPAQGISDGLETLNPSGKFFPLITGRALQALDILIEWIIEGLIPKNSIVLLYGRGGIGKTTLMMILANAIDKGLPVFGMKTVKTKVIIVDYENSLAVLVERAKGTGVDGVLFWSSGQNPPSLDKADWTVFMDLLEEHPGAIFVFDTLRSAHSGDENSSEVMTVIMQRLRQLRDAGATIILLHHTPKGNDRQYKGSGAIFDLCDQTLALYSTAKVGSEKEADDDDDDNADKVYRFGTGKKTRYKPHRVFLTFDKDTELFVLVPDPEDHALIELHGIICQLAKNSSPNQSEVVRAASENKDFNFGGDKKITALLKKGTDRFWTASRGDKNANIYLPIQFGSLAAPIGEEKLPNRNEPLGQFGSLSEEITTEDNLQDRRNAEIGSFSEGDCQTEIQAEVVDADFAVAGET